jgi:hypothetical protein
MDTKQQALSDLRSYEQIFRSGGAVEIETTRGEGEERVTSREAVEYSIKEFVGTRDAIWMFPRVVSNVMIEAQEPILAVTPLLDVIRINTGVRTVDFHAVGALQAFEIPEAQEYPETDLAWSEGAKTAKVTKKGLKIPITQEMIDDSLFDLMAMYMRAAGKALARFKEQIAVGRLTEAATTIKNNAADNSWDGKRMKGVAADGTPNGTFDAEDVLDVFADMLGTGRTPDTIIMHPLAWPMFANDPVIRNLSWYVNGPAVNGNGTKLADNAPVSNPGAVGVNPSMTAFLQKTAPMGLRLICTPWVFYDATNALTDIYILDSSDLGALTVREDVTTEQFDDPTRDIVAMKVRERYDITVFPNEGHNIARLANVKIARNYGKDVNFTVDGSGVDDAFDGIAEAES